MQTSLFQLVKDNRSLFWSVGEEKLQDLDEPAVVETILNLGNIRDLKKLFEILGTEKVADIFYFQLSQKRNNYYPQVSYFFDKYFRRHVQKYS
jgi:hypothetical protein